MGASGCCSFFLPVSASLPQAWCLCHFRDALSLKTQARKSRPGCQTSDFIRRLLSFPRRYKQPGQATLKDMICNSLLKLCKDQYFICKPANARDRINYKWAELLLCFALLIFLFYTVRKTTKKANKFLKKNLGRTFCKSCMKDYIFNS